MELLQKKCTGLETDPMFRQKVEKGKQNCRAWKPLKTSHTKNRLLPICLMNFRCTWKAVSFWSCSWMSLLAKNLDELRIKLSEHAPDCHCPEHWWSRQTATVQNIDDRFLFCWGKNFKSFCPGAKSWHIWAHPLKCQKSDKFEVRRLGNVTEAAVASWGILQFQKSVETSVAVVTMTWKKASTASALSWVKCTLHQVHDVTRESPKGANALADCKFWKGFSVCVRKREMETLTQVHWC